MKKFFSWFSLALFIFTLGSQTTRAAEVDETMRRIEEKKKLVVGVSADYAPLEFHATVDGKDKVVGIDISIAQKIADDLNAKLVIQEFGFDALMGALKTGKVDMVISGMTPTPERLQEVDFSDSYMEVEQKVIVRKEDQDKLKTVEDFNGVKVGAQKQSIQEELAQDPLAADVVSLQKLPDIILQLQNKKVDAAVVEGPVAEAYLQQNKDLVFSKVKFEGVDKKNAIALQKERPKFLAAINASLKTINDDNLIEGYKKEAASHMFKKESFFDKYKNYYLTGMGYTIFLALIGVLFGAVLGSLLALMKLSKNKLLRWPAIAYIEYVRGTPLLVQIFLVFFGSNVVGLDLSALSASCLALALNSGAYVAEIVRAGINAVDIGQTESARSLGMNPNQTLRYIIMPQAIKNILPALGNEFVTVIKESSVVSVIGVSELMFQAGVVQGSSFKPFLPIVIASMIYFFLTFTLSRLLGVAERRMNAHA
ncbi:ABC transporter substrate-binding protein/permease [Vagococcus sp.]|uniref:ABC transporter substrate-binding protein/permease n=1 Tax=Vagococcus sp. TaxID=1933889 RepID=UPI003F973A90